MAKDNRLRKHVHDNLTSFPILGKGTFGTVYQAEGPTGAKYALKVSSLEDATRKEEQYLVAEATILSRFSHPHVVRYVDSWEERDKGDRLHVYLLMEYCQGADLLSFLKVQGPPDKRQFGTWLTQIASGLHYIHSIGILHRNLKTSNIMVAKNQGETILKIGDLAMSKILERPGAMAVSIVGTPYFMSPEVRSGQQYNHKTDVWSFGCTAFEIATVKTIFQAKIMKKLMSDTQEGLDNILEENIQYGTFYVRMISKMLRIKSAERPDALDILKDLINKGYSSNYPDDPKVSTCSSTSDSRKKKSSRKKTTKTISPVPEQHKGAGEAKARKHSVLVDMPQSSASQSSETNQASINKHGLRSQMVHKTPAGTDGRPERSQSESDIHPDILPVLRRFTLDRRIDKTLKNVTFMQQVSDKSTDVSISMTQGSSSGYETDVSSNCLSVTNSSPRTRTSSAVSSTRTDSSSDPTSARIGSSSHQMSAKTDSSSTGRCTRTDSSSHQMSGRTDSSSAGRTTRTDSSSAGRSTRTDSSSAGRSTRTDSSSEDFNPYLVSDDFMGEDDEIAPAEKTMRLVQRLQRDMTDDLGIDLMRAAYGTLSIRDECSMLCQLENVLGDRFDDVRPNLLLLRCLETELDAESRRLETPRRGGLGHTI